MHCDQTRSLLLIAGALVPATLSIISVPSGKPTIAANIKTGLIFLSPLNSLFVVVMILLEIASYYTMRLGSIRVCLQFAGAHFLQPRNHHDLECGRARGYTWARRIFFLAATVPGYVALFRNADSFKACSFPGPKVLPAWITPFGAAKVVVSLFVVHFVLIELLVWATPSHFGIKDANEAWPSQPLVTTKIVDCDPNYDQHAADVAEKDAADQWQDNTPATSCLYNGFRPFLLVLPLDKDVTKISHTWHYIYRIAFTPAAATLPLRCTPTGWPHARCLLFKVFKTAKILVLFPYALLEAILTIHLVDRALQPCIQSALSQIFSPTTSLPILSTLITYAWKFLCAYIICTFTVKIAAMLYKKAGGNPDAPAPGEQESLWSRLVRHMVLIFLPYAAAIFLYFPIGPDAQTSVVLKWVVEGIVACGLMFIAWKVGERVAGLPSRLPADGTGSTVEQGMEGSSENTATKKTDISPSSYNDDGALKEDGYDVESQRKPIEMDQNGKLGGTLRYSDISQLSASLAASRATVVVLAFSLRAAWYLFVEKKGQ